METLTFFIYFNMLIMPFNHSKTDIRSGHWALVKACSTRKQPC